MASTSSSAYATRPARAGTSPSKTASDPRQDPPLPRRSGFLSSGTIVQYLLSDAGQKDQWPKLKPLLTAGKALYFSHGFSIVYKDQTGVIPPADIDVILVAPKGSGTTVRRLFLEGKGINASYAIHQDATGRALERCLATGIAIGSGYMFETTFQKEVFSDLTGERGVLMGAIYGLWLAQYEVLREHGHSPSEAFNETVEEATQSLYPLIAENGMDWMYANCSTTAQRGALDWFKVFRDATKPTFEKLYQSVAERQEEDGEAFSTCNSAARLPPATGEGTQGSRGHRDVASGPGGAVATARTDFQVEGLTQITQCRDRSGTTRSLRSLL